MDFLYGALVGRRVIGIWADEKVKHQRSTLLYQQNMWQNPKILGFALPPILPHQQPVMFVSHISCNRLG